MLAILRHPKRLLQPANHSYLSCHPAVVAANPRGSSPRCRVNIVSQFETSLKYCCLEGSGHCPTSGPKVPPGAGCLINNIIKLMKTLSRKYVTIAQYDPNNRYKAQIRPGVPSGDGLW